MSLENQISDTGLTHLMIEMGNFSMNWVCVLFNSMADVILDFMMDSIKEQKVTEFVKHFEVTVDKNLREFKASEYVHFHF